MDHPKDFPSVSLDSVQHLPSSAGIYFALRGSEVLYIGQSDNMQRRWVNSHHKMDELRALENVRIHFILSDGRPLLQQEAEWISAFSPPMNKTGWYRMSVKLPYTRLKSLSLISFAALGTPAVLLAVFFAVKTGGDSNIFMLIYLLILALFLGMMVMLELAKAVTE